MPFDPNAYPEKPNAGGSRSALLPVGKHRCTATVLECGATIVVEFSRQSDGCKRRAWMPTEGGAAFKLANLLRAVGWHHPVDTDNIEACRAALEAVPLEIVVADETYNGKTEAKVRFTNRLPGTPDRAPRQHEGAPYGTNGAIPDDDPEIPF